MGYQTITFLVTVVGGRRFGIHSAHQTAEDAAPSNVPGPVSKVNHFNFPGASKLAEKGNIRRSSVDFSPPESRAALESTWAPIRRPMGRLGFMAQQIIGDAADDFQGLFGTRILIPSFMVRDW
jgi:hypothetical protein